jgi:tRNA(fMet)-specific endonuclease VapC
MTGNSLALDTNQAIHILNDVPVALAFYGGCGELMVPVTVSGELRFGAYNSRRRDENLEKIERLMSRCRVVSVTDATALEYARVRFELERIGNFIPENDVWIAAACFEHGVPLATADKHFLAVAGLIVVPPPAP